MDDKIVQLKTLQSRIEAMLGQRDAKETEQLDGLVKVYTAMKPKDAARIFAALDDTVRIGVASRMKADIMAGILAALPPRWHETDGGIGKPVQSPPPTAAPSAPAGCCASTSRSPAQADAAAPAASAPTPTEQRRVAAAPAPKAKS